MRKDIAEKFFVLFNNDMGKEVLEYLDKTYLKAPTMGQAVDGQTMALQMAFREGQNELVREVHKLIKKGQENNEFNRK